MGFLDLRPFLTGNPRRQALFNFLRSNDTSENRSISNNRVGIRYEIFPNPDLGNKIKIQDRDTLVPMGTAYDWVQTLFKNISWTVKSQVKVHHVNVAKVSYYNEFNYRSQALFNEIEKGKFQEFDKDDLQKLNVLQRRAVQYVAYYIKV